MEKDGGKINIADALTKEAAGESIKMHLDGIGMEKRDGRHELAPVSISDDDVKQILDKR